MNKIDGIEIEVKRVEGIVTKGYRGIRLAETEDILEANAYDALAE